MPRCKVRNQINKKVCKRTAAACEHLCAQHLALFPTCACCLEPVFPGSDRHLQTPCGHAFHFECAQKWTIQRESVGTKTTCPTCRAPFSHCMRVLLDTTAPTRRIAISMREITVGGLRWNFGSFDSLIDVANTVSEMLRIAAASPVPIPTPFISKDGDNYVFKTLKGRMLVFSPDLDPTKAVIALLVKIHELFVNYTRAKEEIKRLDDVAKQHLAGGRQLKCTLF